MSWTQQWAGDSSRKYYVEIVISSLKFVQSKNKSLNLQKWDKLHKARSTIYLLNKTLTLDFIKCPSPAEASSIWSDFASTILFVFANNCISKLAGWKCVCVCSCVYSSNSIEKFFLGLIFAECVRVSLNIFFSL